MNAASSKVTGHFGWSAAGAPPLHFNGVLPPVAPAILIPIATLAVRGLPIAVAAIVITLACVAALIAPFAAGLALCLAKLAAAFAQLVAIVAPAVVEERGGALGVKLKF